MCFVCHFSAKCWGGAVKRVKEGVKTHSAVYLEMLLDGMPHPRITHLHPSESRDGNSEQWSAVEYKVRR